MSDGRTTETEWISRLLAMGFLVSLFSSCEPGQKTAEVESGEAALAEAESGEPRAGKLAIIEATLLWKAELDSVTWEPLELKKLLSDASRFEQEGSFYKVKDGTTVFGHEAVYVGILGVDLIPGPNAVLKGSPEEIVAAIEELQGISFKKQDGEYQAVLKEDIVLAVGLFPSIPGTSLVIGAYLGS